MLEKNPDLTVDQVKEALYSNAKKIQSGKFDGNGRVDAFAAVNSVTPPGPPNNPPTANDGLKVIDEDIAKAITLEGTDVDGDAITFSIASGPTSGSLGTIGTVTCDVATPKNCTADVLYTPNADYFGPDEFQFTTNDGALTSPAGTISITVDPVPDAPTANSDSVSTDEGVALTITLAGSDVDGDALTFSLVAGSGPSNGVLGTIGTVACDVATPKNCTADVLYTPKAGFDGTDSFQFTTNDGALPSTAAMVTRMVNTETHTLKETHTQRET